MAREENLLTARKVATVGDGWHADGNNLYLRVDGQRRRWICRVSRGGKKRDFGLGSVNTTSLKLARQKRDALLDQLRDGLDPIAEKRQAKAKQDKRKTFAMAADAVVKARSTGWRTSWEGRESSMSDWVRSLAIDCKPIRGKAVDEIGVDEVKQCVQPFWDRGQATSARRLLNRIELVMSYAIAHGWRTADNPASWKIFQHLSPSIPKNGRRHHTALDWRAMPDFMARLRKVDALGALVVEFIILTGARSGEARGAKWSEIDGTVWRIPAPRMKGGEPHDAPLSRQAMALLGRMKAVRTADWIFHSGRRKGPLNLTATWKLMQTLAPGITVHGLRSTFRDWCGDHGVDREVAEAALAHKVGNAVEQAYARSSLIERRRPVYQLWADFLDGEADEGKVVTLKGKRSRDKVG
jgi:integrase